VDGVLVELQGERLEKGDVIRHDLLVGKVESVANDLVHIVVGEQVIYEGGRWPWPMEGGTSGNKRKKKEKWRSRERGEREER
jgi:hypothetical protein